MIEKDDIFKQSTGHSETVLTCSSDSVYTVVICESIDSLNYFSLKHSHGLTPYFISTYQSTIWLILFHKAFNFQMFLFFVFLSVKRVEHGKELFKPQLRCRTVFIRVQQNGMISLAEIRIQAICIPFCDSKTVQNVIAVCFFFFSNGPYGQKHLFLKALLLQFSFPILAKPMTALYRGILLLGNSPLHNHDTLIS